MSGGRLLVTDRNALVLIERARVHVHAGRVVYYATDEDMVRRFNLPHANVAVVMLGQGSSITQDAAARLADENVLLAFAGTAGTPLHLGALTSYKATERFVRAIPIYASDEASLAAAKAIMRRRTAFMRASVNLTGLVGPEASIISACDAFDTAMTGVTRHDALMSAEGDFAKRVYGAFSAAAGITSFARDPGSRRDAMNRFVDHGNYLAYGVAGAACWALGLPPSLSFCHGKTRPGGLVFDVADGWKDGVVVPLAAIAAAASWDEQRYRAAVTDLIEDKGLIAESIRTIDAALDAGEQVIGPPPNLRFR